MSIIGVKNNFTSNSTDGLDCSNLEENKKQDKKVKKVGKTLLEKTKRTASNPCKRKVVKTTRKRRGVANRKTFEKAVIRCDLKTLQSFVRRGLDIKSFSVQDQQNLFDTLSQYLVPGEYNEVIKFLAENGFDIKNCGKNFITSAIYKGCVELVNFLVESGVEATDFFDGMLMCHSSGLNSLAKIGNLKLLRSIIEKRPDILKEHGPETLKLISTNASLKTIQCFLEYGVDVTQLLIHLLSDQASEIIQNYRDRPRNYDYDYDDMVFDDEIPESLQDYLESVDPKKIIANLSTGDLFPYSTPLEKAIQFILMHNPVFDRDEIAKAIDGRNLEVLDRCISGVRPIIAKKLGAIFQEDKRLGPVTTIIQQYLGYHKSPEEILDLDKTKPKKKLNKKSNTIGLDAPAQYDDRFGPGNNGVRRPEKLRQGPLVGPGDLEINGLPPFPARNQPFENSQKNIQTTDDSSSPGICAESTGESSSGTDQEQGSPVRLDREEIESI